MRLRILHGPDLTAAMTTVRDALGDDALILETREGSGGIEILVAVAAANPAVPEPLDVVPVSDARRDRLRESLRWHGISEDLLPAMLGGDLVRAVNRAVRFGDLPTGDGDPPLLFAGEPGAGKSLSVIKVATRLVMGGREPLVISTDGHKAGAIEQLAAMTRLLGLTLVVTDDARQLKRAVARRRGNEPVLIDSPGLLAGSAADGELLEELAHAAAAEILLVLPAGLDVAEAAEVACAYAALGAKRLLATRLDVTHRIGGIVEPAGRAGLLLTEASTGPDAAGGLVSVTASMVAQRLSAIKARQSPTRASPPLSDRRTVTCEMERPDEHARQHPVRYDAG